MFPQDRFDLIDLDLVDGFLKRDLFIRTRIMYLAIVAREFLPLRVLGIPSQHQRDIVKAAFGCDGFEAILT